jgi:hypothetical protein
LRTLGESASAAEAHAFFALASLLLPQKYTLSLRMMGESASAAEAHAFFAHAERACLLLPQKRPLSLLLPQRYTPSL